MKRINLRYKSLINTGIQVILSYWGYLVYDYFYGLNLQLTAVLVISLGISVYLAHRIESIPINRPVKGVLSIIACLIPFLLYPLTAWSIEWWSQSWIVLYIMLITGIFTVGLLKNYSSLAAAAMAAISVFFLPYDFFPDQNIYRDRLVKSVETNSGKVHVTTWRNHKWIFHDRELKLSTIDKHILEESFVIPALMNNDGKEILVIGGSNGIAVSGLGKFAAAEANVKFIPDGADYFEAISSISVDALPVNFEKIQDDPVAFLKNSFQKFDLIFIDLLDIEMMGPAFFESCKERLNEKGIVVFNAGDYHKALLHQLVKRGLESYGLDVMVYHTQVPTIGQNSWVMARKSGKFVEIENQDTPKNARWWTPEAMQMMSSSGKMGYFRERTQYRSQYPFR